MSSIPDPRVPRCRRYRLVDILVVAVCAILCGANHFTQIEEFAHARKDWLRERLGIEGDVPSHDTFRRVFALLDPSVIARCLTEWGEGVRALLQSEGSEGHRPGISLDGKVLRRSFTRSDKTDLLHVVTAWANDLQLCLAQVRVSDKSNEITALPHILEMLDVRGCIVTIDAMGCQKEVARKIIEQGGDHILSLKGNHPNLEQRVALFFESELKQQRYEKTLRSFTTLEKDHGRIERREFFLADELSLGEDLSWLDQKNEWTGLASVGRVVSRRTINGQTSVEVRHFLCSIQGSAEEFAHHVRGHWGIENSQHWVLDIAFREDECRLRMDNTAENFALARKIALNLIKSEKTARGGAEAKRLRCGWDTAYLERVLAQRSF